MIFPLCKTFKLARFKAFAIRSWASVVVHLFFVELLLLLSRIKEEKYIHQESSCCFSDSVADIIILLVDSWYICFPNLNRMVWLSLLLSPLLRLTRPSQIIPTGSLHIGQCCRSIRLSAFQLILCPQPFEISVSLYRMATSNGFDSRDDFDEDDSSIFLKLLPGIDGRRILLFYYNLYSSVYCLSHRHRQIASVDMFCILYFVLFQIRFIRKTDVFCL